VAAQQVRAENLISIEAEMLLCATDRLIKEQRAILQYVTEKTQVFLQKAELIL
jgi:hypothetical protein